MMAEGAGQPIPESIATCFRQRLTTGGENESGGMEQTIAMQDRLIAVLREMPGCRAVQMPEPQPPQEGKRGRKAKKGILPGAQGERGPVAPGGSGGLQG